MNLQYVIVLIIVLLAAGYLARSLFAKRRSFSKASGCDQDCGCNSGGK